MNHALQAIWPQYVFKVSLKLLLTLCSILLDLYSQFFFHNASTNLLLFCFPINHHHCQYHLVRSRPGLYSELLHILLARSDGMHLNLPVALYNYLSVYPSVSACLSIRSSKYHASDRLSLRLPNLPGSLSISLSLSLSIRLSALPSHHSYDFLYYEYIVPTMHCCLSFSSTFVKLGFFIHVYSQLLGHLISCEFLVL
jgi:hypothetical protein